MARLHTLLLADGIQVVPRGLWFLSTTHTTAHVAETLEVADAASPGSDLNLTSGDPAQVGRIRGTRARGRENPVTSQGSGRIAKMIRLCRRLSSSLVVCSLSLTYSGRVDWPSTTRKL
jgi:hypothetical protein